MLNANPYALSKSVFRTSVNMRFFCLQNSYPPVPVSMMHQQSAAPQYSSAQAGGQHYQGQQTMGMMGPSSQGNSMMSQRPMGSYRASQQGRRQSSSIFACGNVSCEFALAVLESKSETCLFAKQI